MGGTTPDEVEAMLGKGVAIEDIATERTPWESLWKVLGVSDANEELDWEANTIIVELDVRQLPIITHSATWPEPSVPVEPTMEQCTYPSLIPLNSTLTY